MKYVVLKRIQEGDKVYMPGDEYKGGELKKLGPSHPWVKAGWLKPEEPKRKEAPPEEPPKDDGKGKK